MGKYLLTAYLAALSFAAYPFQSEALFSIDNQSVSSEEFTYFYKKNSQNNPEVFTREDVENYLTLFIDFKLKVVDAKRLGYDTTAAFRNELSGYLKQLSESFLNSNDFEEQLIQEAYDRKLYDMDASHILINVSDQASPEDTLKAFEKAMNIYRMASEGQDFSDLAAKFSEEPGATTSKGKLGYFTVFQMVYPFESAVYNLQENEVSMPVRSQFGYHVIKLNKKRPAMGIVEVDHIMVRFSPGMTASDSSSAFRKISLAYENLSRGVPWDSVCMRFSEDIVSKQNGGAIRPFGVRGLNVPEFEQVAYGTKVGSFSKPFKSPFGWHILKVNRKNTIGSFEEERGAILNRLNNDSRSKFPRDQWIQNLKQKYEFKQGPNFASKIEFLYDTAVHAKSSEIMFSLGHAHYDQLSIQQHFKGTLIKNKNEAFRQYNVFIEDKLIEKEEASLMKNSLEYRMLKKEYYEGILLFSIMEDKVWNKAEADSSGLRNYYERNKSQFNVKGPTGVLLHIDPTSQTNAAYNNLLQNFDNLSDTGSTETIKIWAETTLSSQSGLNLQFEEKGYVEDDPTLEKLTAGINLISEGDNLAVLILNDESVERMGEFHEVRGRVISRYQDKLEDEWLRELHSLYKVKVRKKILNEILNEIESK